MLKLLTLAAPLLLKGRPKPPVRFLVGRLLMGVLIFTAFFCFVGALFVWIMKAFSLELAFAAIGGVLLFFAALAAFIFRPAREAVKEVAEPIKLEGDALSKFIPDTLTKDPIIQRALQEINAKPVAATAAAVVAGLLLSREFFDRD